MFRRGAPSSTIAVPVTVLGELHGGFELGSHVQENLVALAEFLAEPFVTVIQTTPSVARHYGRVYAALRRAGTPIPTNDMWIAAATLDTGACLVTLDRDFTRVQGLDCIVIEAGARIPIRVTSTARFRLAAVLPTR